MKQTSIYTLALAALMLIAAACSDEQYDNSQQPDGGASGPLITVTATQDDRPQTRLGYNDPNDLTKPIAVTWAERDQFYISKRWTDLRFSSGDYLYYVDDLFFPLTLTSGAGSKKADFEGYMPTGLKNGDLICAIHGDGRNRITTVQYPNRLACKYDGQEQTGNNSTAYLTKADFMTATTTYETGKQPVFNFTRLGAMIKFNLTLPTTGLKVKRLKLSTTDGSTPFSDKVILSCEQDGVISCKSDGEATSDSIALAFDRTTLTGTNVLTAYMMVAPTTLTKETNPIAGKELLLKVYCETGNYTATLKGAEIEPGKYYTIEETLQESIESMKFTIKLTKAGDFTIPFTTKTIPADLIVNWGDGGSKSYVNKGATTGENTFTHPYRSTGPYTITITSSQLDDSKQQIPNFSFKDKTNDRDKLISMDTPLLNTGQEDFAKCFYYCKNLVSLSAGLFSKNKQATDFMYCFNNTSLVSLPDNLFYKNTLATNFSSCFFECTSLKELPAGLFSKNTEATNFNGCFSACTSLKELPTGLFDNNKKVTNFGACFSGCTALASLPIGLFSKNTLATNFMSCFYKCASLKELPTGLFDNNEKVTTFQNCFGDCTALASLPIGLFNNNAEANDYRACFAQCYNLVLNDKIFEANGNTTVFKYRKTYMYFDGCFVNAGSRLNLENWKKSQVPLLWLFDPGSNGFNLWTVATCYTETGASNLEDNIPPTEKQWGTPAPKPTK